MDETNEIKEATEPVIETNTEKKRRKNALKNMGKEVGTYSKNFFTDFKNFMNKGNVLNLAIAFVMGASFNAIVTSLVDGVFTPLFGLMFGKQDIAQMYFMINNTKFMYGAIILAVIEFLFISLFLFVVIRIVTGVDKNTKKLSKKMKRAIRRGEEPAPEIKPEEPPKPTNEELTLAMLTEIRDLLKSQQPDQSAK